MTGQQNYEYINDYLYFVVRPAPDRGINAWVYCSGVNVSRFFALTQGRHGLSSNPAIRGLQLLKHNVSRLAISRGAPPRLMRGKDCSGIAPTQETWYSEILLIEDMPDSLAPDIIKLCSIDLLEKIILSCWPAMKHPGSPLAPAELQDFIVSLLPAS